MHQFHVFQAYALVPEFVYERLFVGHDGAPASLAPGTVITREALRLAIEEAFPPPVTFPAYLKHWGRFQPAEVIAQLGSKPIRDVYDGLRQRLQDRYETTFGIRLGKAWGMGKRMKEEGRGPLLEEARSFRGGSPFACGVLLARSQQRELEPQTYDLFWLLANVELDLLDEEQFIAAAPGYPATVAAIRRGKPAAYFRLLAYRAERRDVLVRLPAEVAAWGPEQQHTAEVLTGLKVELAGAPWLNELNHWLAQRKVVGLIVPGLHPLELRRKLRLPLLFPLHSYEDINGVRGCVVFARQALILDTALRYRKLSSGTPEAPIML